MTAQTGRRKLTEAQRELLSLIVNGGNIIGFVTPGTTKEQFHLEKKGDNRDLDGRTVASLVSRGFIKSWGRDGQFSEGFAITEAGRTALAENGAGHA